MMLGAPASSINEAIAKMKENDPYSPIQLLKGLFLQSFLVHFFWFILAAFF
jgi:hypothetical protein